MNNLVGYAFQFSLDELSALCSLNPKARRPDVGIVRNVRIQQLLRVKPIVDGRDFHIASHIRSLWRLGPRRLVECQNLSWEHRHE